MCIPPLICSYENITLDVCPAKIVSTRAFAKSYQNLHRVFFSIANDAKFLHADNKNSDQAALMHRLI